MESPLWWNVLAMALVAASLVLLRMRQESIRRELDALRRHAHAL
jgi:hypothetical protein